MTPFLAHLSAQNRCATPWVGGRSFLTPTQRDFRNKAMGYQATPGVGAHAPLRKLTRQPTGAATMEDLEPDGQLYRSVMGTWGRVTRAGRP